MYILVGQCCRLEKCFVCLFRLFVIIFRFRVGSRVEMVRLNFELVAVC